MSKRKLSKIQKFEISRLLDERYVLLHLRLKRCRILYDKMPSMYDEVVNEMELIDSIFEFF